MIYIFLYINTSKFQTMYYAKKKKENNYHNLKLHPSNFIYKKKKFDCNFVLTMNYYIKLMTCYMIINIKRIIEINIKYYKQKNNN